MSFDFSLFEDIDSITGIDEIELDECTPDQFDFSNDETFSEPIDDTISDEQVENIETDQLLDISEYDIPGFSDWYQQIHGEPFSDAEVWSLQTTDYTCGIVSAKMVLSMNGLDLSEADLVYNATSEGLLTDGGMTLPGIKQLLDMYGLDSRICFPSFDELVDVLNTDKQVILPVDSGEIWGEDSPFEDSIQGLRPDHAVVLTGIDTDSETVFLNDPGHPDGAAMEVSLNRFIDAWEDSGKQCLFIDSQYGINT